MYQNVVIVCEKVSASCQQGSISCSELYTLCLNVSVLKKWGFEVLSLCISHLLSACEQR